MQACSRYGSLYRSNVVRYSFHLTCLYGPDLCSTYLLAHLSLCLWPCEGQPANEFLRLVDGLVCGSNALTKVLCVSLKTQSFSRSSQVTLVGCCVVLSGLCYPPFDYCNSSIVKLPPEPASTISWELSFFFSGGYLCWDVFSVFCTVGDVSLQGSKMARIIWLLNAHFKHFPLDAMLCHVDVVKILTGWNPLSSWKLQIFTAWMARDDESQGCLGKKFWQFFSGQV